MADREPMGTDDRPNGEMTDLRPAQGAPHASHDLFVIVAAADRDADAAARAAADLQMRDCADCTALFADLQAISTGLSALPRELPAPRDFRITPERAARLRRRGWRAAFDSMFRNPSLRPFGNALATLGFAGLLLTVAVPAFTGGFGGASAPAVLDTVGNSVGSGAGGGAPQAQVPAASAASAPGVTSNDGKAGATPPVDSAAGAGSEASGAPVASTGSEYVYGAVSSPSMRDLASGGRTSTDANGGATGAATGAAGPTVAGFLPWLSLGVFLAGLTLLAIARFGGRRAVG